MGRVIAERPRKARQPSRPSKRAAGEDIRERFRIFVEDRVWVDEHHEELLARYPERWIAVLNKRVIASDPDLIALRGKVAEPQYTCHAFLTKDHVDVIL